MYPLVSALCNLKPENAEKVEVERVAVEHVGAGEDVLVWLALVLHHIKRRSKRESQKNTYQQSRRLADVLLGRLAVLPALVPLAVVVGDLVLIAGFDWCGGGHGGGGCEEEELGELHGCLCGTRKWGLVCG